MCAPSLDGSGMFSASQMALRILRTERRLPPHGDQYRMPLHRLT